MSTTSKIENLVTRSVARSDSSLKSHGSKCSVHTQTSEYHLRMLELQLQQEMLNLESKYERREQEREKELLKIKQEVSRIRLVNEARSEPARTRAHSSQSDPGTDSEMSCVLDVKLKSHSAQEIRCDKWASDVNSHIENGTIDPQPRSDFCAAASRIGCPSSDLKGCESVGAPIQVDTQSARQVLGPITSSRLPPIPESSVLYTQSTPLNPSVPPFTTFAKAMSNVQTPIYTGHEVTNPLTMVQATHILQALDSTMMSQQELSRRTLLPPIKLERFSGDLTKFVQFRNTFTWNVESNTEDPKRRLTHLYNQLDGPPRKLIEGCLHLPPAEGYEMAWTLLNKEYEDSHNLIEAYIKKLLEWKDIDVGDVEELEEYGSYLFNVQCALRENIMRMELREVMTKVVSKLPKYLRNKWATRCVIQASGCSFTSLVAFVKEQAKVAKEGRYIEEARSKQLSIRSKVAVSKKPKGLTVSTTHPVCESNIGTDECLCCNKQGHALHACFKFGRLNIQDRWNTAMSKRLCFRCLKPSHGHRDCKDKSKCGQCGADSHHTILHRPLFKTSYTSARTVSSTRGRDGQNQNEASGGGVKNRGEDVLPCASLTNRNPDGRIMMKILPVMVNNEVYTYAFIDCGAAVTLAARSLIKKLGIKGKHISQTMRTENGDFKCDELVSLSIGSVDEDEDLMLNDVYVTGKLSVTTDHMMPVRWASQWSHLSDIKLSRLPPEYKDVELIIGLNSFLCRHILSQRHGEENEPSAYLTRFGWVAFGPTGPKNSIEIRHVHHIQPTDNLRECLQEHFNKDFWEKEIHSRQEDSVEDKLFMIKMSESIHQESGKYILNLPFRNNARLPNNRKMAIHRLIGLKKKLKNDDAYRQSYVSSVEKYISKEYAELVPTTLLDRDDGRVWYMPHHAVRHPTKPKLRVVYDLKAKFQGISLNDHLLQGPDLTNALIGVILRFRQGQYAVTADIEEMFHQVKVPPEDRDVLRFLWWPGGDTNQAPAEYRMSVHVFGARSSPSCVDFALRRTAEEHGSQYGNEVIEVIKRNFYVDNLLKASDDEESMKQLVKDLIDLCAAGGWRLNQWTSNNKNILATIPETERDNSVASLDLSKDELPMERTLGMHWSMEKDYFTYKINPKDKPLTRRGVLSVVASIYDPLGMVAPFTLPAKLLLQDMCRQQLGWDEEMEMAEVSRWKAWLDQLPKLINFKMPRSFIPISFGTVRSSQLHHFADASQVGYGIASYLRLESATGEVYCTLVMGRARVAPLKRMTIPRLELTAATVAARMDQKLRSELDLSLEKSVFWTDSTSVLKYLFNEKARYQTFVANRVNLIRELSPVEAWRYVETQSNPADLASRGVDIDSFLASSIWITGPTFLCENEKMWPILPKDVRRGTLEDDPEVKSPQLLCETVITAISFIEEIASHFSNWTKFVHCIAWLRRFRRTLTQRLKSSVEADMTRKCLCTEEVHEAENNIWRLVQKDSFGAEIKILSGSEEAHVRASSKLVKLKPYLKDGLLRVRGRLINSPTSFDVKHPIILPSKSTAVKLMVQWKHKNLAHSGHNYLMAELRQKFWIIHGNAVVRSVIRNCVKCRSLSARPMTQEMADLPEDRVTSNVPPFTHTGTDCFGPFLVKKGRSNLKRYGVIFTCLVTRAIHIEVVESMETDSYINAFRRFIARRGPVTSIRSDNGKNLVGAEKELREELKKMKHSVIAEVMLLKGVTWQFIPPHASHFGGVWERQIRTIRRVLRGLCHQQVMTDDTLHTLFCEVEAIINGRPLTRVTDDPDDPQPLTPNMLLTLKGTGSPITDTDHSDLYVRRRWRQVQYLADLFWKRWTKEYLPLLQERQKWTTRQRNLKVGDIVLSLDDKLPRGSWPLGRVLEVISNADGQVRSARLRTASGEYLRPISKMCLLLENEIDVGVSKGCTLNAALRY